MAAMERAIFCVSDHTGLTAESFAHSLITLFEDLDAHYVMRPFIDTPQKLEAVVAEIDAHSQSGDRAIVFSTFSDPQMQQRLLKANALVLGLFEDYADRVADELGAEPSRRVGRHHGIGDTTTYQQRLDAVDFTLSTDDGLGLKHYSRADLILVGVSRVGKTPTCLYLSMQYAVKAANYPLALEDQDGRRLPDSLRPFRNRLFGLTIDPGRLLSIRQQRRPDSRYASLEHCRREVAHAERLFRSTSIPYLDTTSRSVEEIAVSIMRTAQIGRHHGGG